MIIGLLVALARTVKSPIFLPIRVLATLYVDIFRGVPTILVIFLLGFGMPALQLTGVPSDAIFWGTAALVLSYGAYVAEVFRAGIGSVHPSQTMAARSLGLSSLQSNRFVVLPQAVRNVTPPLLNDFISLKKTRPSLQFWDQSRCYAEPKLTRLQTLITPLMWVRP